MIKIKLSEEDYQNLCKILESAKTTNFYDARIAELNNDFIMQKLYDNISNLAANLFEKLKGNH